MRTVKIDEITSDWLLANLPDVAELIRAQGEATGREAASQESSTALEAAATAAREEGLAAGRQEATESARVEGATAERERILGIQRTALPGQEALAQELIEDPTITVEAAALRFLESERGQQSAALDALRKTEPKNPPGPGAKSETNKTDAEIKAAGDYIQRFRALR